jgi:hypothetical protein
MILIEGNINKKRSEQYLKLREIASIDGNISDVKVKKGYSYLKIGDTSVVVYPSLNYNYEKLYFSDIVQKGDRIIKSLDSDTITLIQQDTKYIFKHNSTIYK